MVRVGRRQRRSGQAQVAPQNAVPNGQLVQNAFPQNAQAPVNAVPNAQNGGMPGGRLGDDFLENTVRNTGDLMPTDGDYVTRGIGPNGGKYYYINSEGADGEGEGEVLVRIPQEAPAPEPAPQQPPAQCEFDAQSVNFRRDVTITNSEPQVVDARVDVCGNLLGYTETMTRIMTAGDWVPTSGTDGPISAVNVEDNGEAYLARYGPGADIANSAGFDDINFPYNNTGVPSLGSKYLSSNGLPVNNGNGVPNAGGNKNKFGGAMRKFRSK